MAEANHGQKSRQAVGVFHRVVKLRYSLTDLTAAGIESEALCLAGQKALLESLDPHRRPQQDDTEAGSRVLAALTAKRLIIDRAGSGAPIGLSSSEFGEMLRTSLPEADRTDSRWLERWLIPQHARTLENHLAAGRYLLWVGIRDPEDEKRVCTILLKHSDFPVQVHDLAF